MVAGIATFGRDGAVLNVVAGEALVAAVAGVSGGPVVGEGGGREEEEEREESPSERGS